MTTPPAYTIRPARPGDGDAFLRLVEELAMFEELTPPGEEARRRLLVDAFGPAPRYRLLVAEHVEGGVVAYAVHFHAYSTFLARPTLYVEDVYVTPPHRGTGLAEAIMARLARTALDEGCGRLEGVVLDWNARARRFYARTGARELTGWVPFRYEGDALRRLARGAE